MLKKPIELHIYDDDGKIKETHKLCIIPWKVMKKFASVFQSLGNDFTDADMFDKLDGLLCEAFGNRFDEQTLEEHADSAEVMSAIKAIMENIEGVSPNAPAGAEKKLPKSTIPIGGAAANL